MFPLKERIILFFLNMLIAFLMIVFTYVGVTSVIKYLSFQMCLNILPGALFYLFQLLFLGLCLLVGFL